MEEQLFRFVIRFWSSTIFVNIFVCILVPLLYFASVDCAYWFADEADRMVDLIREESNDANRILRLKLKFYNVLFVVFVMLLKLFKFLDVWNITDVFDEDEESC